MAKVLPTSRVYSGTNPLGAFYKGSQKVWEPAVSAFSPSSLAGLQVWLDASQLTGSTVNPWPDLSGQGHHGSIVGSPDPVRLTNVLNGKSVVRFTVNEGRVRGVNGLLSGVPTYNSTVAYVGRMVGPYAGRIFCGLYPAVNYLVGFYINAYEAMYDAGFVNNGVPYPTLPSPWKIYGSDGSHDGTSYLTRFFINGVVSGSATTGGGMGQNYNLSGYDATAINETCDCEVAELLIYDRKLSDTDRQLVESYLNAKWGL